LAASSLLDFYGCNGTLPPRGGRRRIITRPADIIRVARSNGSPVSAAVVPVGLATVLRTYSKAESK